ncbi:hypothetical protein EST38_g14467 [Candolleomyces aberdarensis]|uniref:Uncharacterized protein n=1 Tax=Candolleomyces aberdarensis TaxID=2316362 RepID=A0A4V1Q1F3_9AGAR|nr:hypothetical protein EST38_g14467 [Candolleomyces aberdarensis]
MSFFKKLTEHLDDIQNRITESINNQQQSGQNSNDNQNNSNSAADGVLGNLNGALGGGKQGEAKEGAYSHRFGPERH